MIRPPPGRRALVLGAVLLLGACGDAGVGPGPAPLPIDLSAPWVVADPEALGLDGEALDRVAAEAASIPRLRSLLVVRDGRVALERYWGGAGPDDLADVRSVTKSVVSTLVGIALDREELPGTDATLSELLGEVLPPFPEGQGAITVRDLLTMSGGWDYRESGAVGYNEWIRSGDRLGYLFERPLADEPGTTFAYNSPAVHLLGAALQEAVGMPLEAYARVRLFEPLGIGGAEWEVFPSGRVNGASGIDLRPRDLARLGQLVLQEGRSGPDQVVSSDWVEVATRPAFSWTTRAGPIDVSYGYLWWTDATHGGFFAWGFGGQFVYVSPERALVVVATTEWGRVDGEPVPPGLQYEVLELITEGVLPAAPPR